MLLVRLAAALIPFIGISFGLSMKSSAKAAPIDSITFTVNLAGDAGDGICDETCALLDAATAEMTTRHLTVTLFADSVLPVAC